MIRTIADLRRALKRGQFRGVILYEGPSAFDGQPIACIANRITEASGNAKTGAMVQTFIIRTDIDPVNALRNGQDESVCWNCRHRPKRGGTCYVNVAKSVLSVFYAYLRGRYARPGIDFDAALIPELFRGLVFRLGTYGDPTAVPYQVWRRATLFVAGHAGYVHQWRDPRFAAFKALCMASCDHEQDYVDAHALGWRTFRVRRGCEPVMPGEVICPASKEAGHKTTCASCRACGGTLAKARASIVIQAHGTFARRFAETQALPMA